MCVLLAACDAPAPAGVTLQATPPLAATSPQPSATASAATQLTLTPSPAPLPTATATPRPSATPTALTCWQQGGRIEQGQLETDLLRQPLDYRIYLPPCYAELPEQHYPLLLLIHGQSYTDDQWDRLGVDETADRLIASGELTPFLILMPRDREWTQSNVDPFGQAVIEVLLPYIDQAYRTLPDRPYRAVGGLSRGASWAIHFGLSHWQLFGAIGAHSPPVFWSDVPHVKRWLDDIPAESMPRIFMDIGKNDRPEIMESAVWFEKVLTERNIPHEWYQFSGYHEEAYWQSHLELYLRWYAAEW